MSKEKRSIDSALGYPVEISGSSFGCGVCFSLWMESIIGGVSMICRPYFIEQNLNHRTVEQVWGFGIGVECCKFTKNGAIKALQVILSSKKEKLMRKKIGVLKQLPFKAVNTANTANFNFLMDFISKR
ncbi:hypothetical protein Ddye_021566 [Dipteronia dyeriana]|uniref:Uncharacterized protein n=1 Tax=Dipteronia dyeriana TaxID=168575 RepID=A0AAD9U2P5_9ROSI|nr:hypothetical protein Ddye_021566 [Dipteronia dyeriana]